MTRIISKKLRDSARGQSCTLRLPGCGHDDGTVVLAHLPVGMRGVGIKTPDLFAIHACDACHARLDGRIKAEIDFRDVLRALAETQMRWYEAGLISVRGAA